MWTLQRVQKKLVEINQSQFNKIKSRSSFSDAASWEFLSGSDWQTDSTLSFECIEVQNWCKCSSNVCQVADFPMFGRLRTAVPR